MDPKLALYYSNYCFFCQKVLMFLRGKDRDLVLLDTSDSKNAQSLMQGGGKTQVPCLRIEQADGSVEWMYESNDIIQYLT
jgi:glutathione S-transferase